MASPKSSSDVSVRIEIFSNIKELLRCYQCKKLPRPKVKILKNDSLIMCEICHKKLTDFNEAAQLRRIDGFGKELVIPSFQEDAILNQILEIEVPFECKYAHNGCKEVLLSADILQHEIQCQFSESINC